MPHSCPRPCGRLATSAVFVSVSVIQFIAGLILLKSKYVYLLSGPDFWTAASNFSVGVLLGVSASVWKDVQKTSFKHIVRRNLLASLVASAIIINTTTAIILILGEGNTLLSIQLENDGKSSSTSEILAYSYATSVCSPIVSVVVAIVFLSGMWFRISDKGMKTPEIKSFLKENSGNGYDWVFKGQQSPPKQNSRIVRKELSFKSLSSSSDDESFNSTDAKLWSNSVNSIEYLKTSLRKGSLRIGLLRHGKVQQESACECGEHIKNTPESISREASSASIVNDRKTKKFIKFSPYPAQRHLETDTPPCPNHVGVRNMKVNSPSYADIKKIHKHFKNSKKRHKKRMLLMEHPAFQHSKYLEGDINVKCFQKLYSPEVYIPRVRTRMVSNSKFSVTSEAEVHSDTKSQDYVRNENFSEASIVQYAGDISSNDALIATIRHKNAEFQKPSTLKHLNNSSILQPEDQDLVSRKASGKSTAKTPIIQYKGDVSYCDALTGTIRPKNEKFRRASTLQHLNDSGVSELEDSVTRKVSRMSTTETPIVQYEGNVSFCDTLIGTKHEKNTTFQRESTLQLLSNSGLSQLEDSISREVSRTSTTSTPNIQYEGDVSCDAVTGTISNKNARFQRASTFKHFNDLSASQQVDEDSFTRKVFRTSTAAGPNSSKISYLDISDINSDSVIDQNEPYEFEGEKDTSAVATPQFATSEMDSSIEGDDSFIDVPPPNAFAGEVVKVHVNSLPRSPFHSKLIPVSIPVVSSVQENPLKRKQKYTIKKGTDKLSGRHGHSFSSFHGDLQTMNQDNLYVKTDEENLVSQNYESATDATAYEMHPEDNTPSPAVTSGYESAIFENAHFSGSESFKPNSSSSVANSPYYTPKKNTQKYPSPRNLEIF